MYLKLSEAEGPEHLKVKPLLTNFSLKIWMVELCYKCSSRGTQLDQMEHQIFTQRSLWTSILEQNIHSILEITGCDRCLVAIEKQILLTKVIKYICGWLVLLKMSALKSMKLIFLYSLFGVTKLFMLVYVK